MPPESEMPIVSIIINIFTKHPVNYISNILQGGVITENKSRINK